jgi:hypothetical protein
LAVGWAIVSVLVYVEKIFEGSTAFLLAELLFFKPLTLFLGLLKSFGCGLCTGILGLVLFLVVDDLLLFDHEGSMDCDVNFGHVLAS